MTDDYVHPREAHRRAHAARTEMAAQWYAPATRVWPELHAAGFELYEALSRVEIVDERRARVLPEPYAPTWAVAAMDALYLQAGLDVSRVVDFLAAHHAPERAAVVARAVGNPDRPDTRALTAVFAAWAQEIP